MEGRATDLEAEADPEVGLLMLARVLGREDLALDGAHAEAARDQNAVRVADALPARRVLLGLGVVLGEVLSLHPVDDQLALGPARAAGATRA